MSFSSYSGSYGYGAPRFGSRGYSRASSPRCETSNAKAPVSPMELITLARPSVTLKWPSLYPGQQVYMTAGNRVEPVTFLRNSLGLCQILYESGGTTMVWRRRLFTTMEEAESFLPVNITRCMQEESDTDTDTNAASDLSFGSSLSFGSNLDFDSELDFDYDSPVPAEVHHPVHSQSWRSGNSWEPGDGWARR